MFSFEKEKKKKKRATDVGVSNYLTPQSRRVEVSFEMI